MTHRALTLTALTAGALVIATGIGFTVTWLAREPAADGAAPRPVFQADLGGPFSLVNTAGERVTEADYLGTYTLYYFGFTFCPDICPTELQVIATAYDKLPSAVQENLRMVFVTVDPERDSVEAMADYVDLFHPEMEGLTGTLAETDAAVEEFRVYYQAVNKEEDPEYYLVDHSTFTYLQGPDGANVLVFPYGLGPDDMAEHLEEIVGS